MENGSDLSSLVSTTDLLAPASDDSDSADELYCGQRTSLPRDYFLFRVMFVYVNPGLSIFGFVTNMMSLEILRRSGLHKPSNILLAGLVVADSMSLGNTLNFGLIILQYGPSQFFIGTCTYNYGESLNYFFAFMTTALIYFGFWGRYVGALIPTLITLERILAIFKPIAFKNIATAKRCIVLVVFAFVFWLPYSLFVGSFYKIVSYYVSNLTVTNFQYQDYVIDNFDFISTFEYFVIDTLISWFPLSFITSGCILLLIKIKITLLRRRNLTLDRRSVQWSPRTTRTLMLSCVIFAVTHSIASLVMLFQEIEVPIKLALRNQFIHLLYISNASSNLFVYITTNQKLLDIFIKMISRIGDDSKFSKL